MAPTLPCYKTEGFIEYKYKAGLDLLLPVTVEEIQADIDELKISKSILIFIIKLSFTKKLFYV